MILKHTLWSLYLLHILNSLTRIDHIILLLLSVGLSFLTIIENVFVHTFKNIQSPLKKSNLNKKKIIIVINVYNINI